MAFHLSRAFHTLWSAVNCCGSDWGKTAVGHNPECSLQTASGQVSLMDRVYTTRKMQEVMQKFLKYYWEGSTLWYALLMDTSCVSIEFDTMITILIRPFNHCGSNSFYIMVLCRFHITITISYIIWLSQILYHLISHIWPTSWKELQITACQNWLECPFKQKQTIECWVKNGQEAGLL